VPTISFQGKSNESIKNNLIKTELLNYQKISIKYFYDHIGAVRVLI